MMHRWSNPSGNSNWPTYLAFLSIWFFFARPTDLQFQVISTGKRIYCVDETACGTFDMLTYSTYQRLERERKEIVEVIKERGSVYG